MNLSVICLILSSVILIIFSGALFLIQRKSVFDQDRILDLSQLISEGLLAFFKRMIWSIIQVIFYLSCFIFLFSIIFHRPFSWIQIFAFFLGACFLSLSIFFSLIMIPKIIPLLTTSCKGYLESSITLLFQSTTLMGFIMMGIPLLGFVLCYAFLGKMSIIGYVLGVMLTTYFFRIGGGVYKTASDIGSNIISKIETRIPGFDRRNPATLLDIAGDCVGSIMGFSADIFSSYMLVFVSCILFPMVLLNLGLIDSSTVIKLEHLPFYLVSASLMIAILSFLFSYFRIPKKYSNFLLEGLYFSIIISAIFTFFIIRLFNIQLDITTIWGHKEFYSLFLPYILGLVGATFIAFTSEFFTSNVYLPTQNIARIAEFGSVLTLLKGFSRGLTAIGLFLIYFLVILIPSFYVAGFYGIIMAGLGMLSITPSIILTTIFNPVASILYKLSQLGECSDTVKKHTSKIDQLGQTTTSLGNGFSAAVAAISSLGIFLILIMMIQKKVHLSTLLYVDIQLFIGLMIGVALPFVFSGFLLRGLVKTVTSIIHEVKRQFRDISFLYEDKARPDMIKASDENAIYSMNALTISTFIMLVIPVSVVYIFGFSGFKILVGIIFGTFLVGSNLSICFAFIGDSLKQAKRYIEKGYLGGKGTPRYDYLLISDNFGDALKDLLVPSINILIKSIGILSILVIYLLL